MAVKTSWSSGDVLTAADLTDTFAAKLDASAYTPGLSLVTAESFSSVASVSVNNCFTSTYDNYHLTLLYDASGAGQILLRFRASGSDNTSASYNRQRLVAYGSNVLANRDTAQTSANISNQGGQPSTSHLVISSPNRADRTVGHIVGSYGGASSNVECENITFGFDNTTVFDGLTLSMSSGTFTGTLRIYGYRN